MTNPARHSPLLSLHLRVGVLLSVGFTAVLFGLSSCSTAERAGLVVPDVPGASFVGNRACFECHSNITRVFAASAHGRLHFETAQMAGQTGCEACHGPASKHVAVGGGRGRFIVNPGKSPEACFNCHMQTHAQFQLREHHPVMEGRMNCAQCHDPHGMDIFKSSRGLISGRQSEACAECHREQAMPHAFEHEALREGCAACHEPHGSVNAKLLNQRDNNLCLKCHAQNPGAAIGSREIYIGSVPHTDFLRMGGCYSAGCHTAVHGSNIDRRLLY